MKDMKDNGIVCMMAIRSTLTCADHDIGAYLNKTSREDREKVISLRAAAERLLDKAKKALQKGTREDIKKYMNEIDDMYEKIVILLGESVHLSGYRSFDRS